MRFLLDSNAVICVLRGHTGFLSKLCEYRPQDFGISSIVAHELFYGACKGQQVAENLARVEALQFEVVDFDCEDARHAGEVGARLALAGTPIGPFDALIAGQALARDLVLITHNVGEFQRVAGLRFEDWE